MNIHTGFAEIRGAKFYYEVAGEGHALALVHAGIADCRMWDEQFRLLARHFQVLRFDRRGFGKTPMVPGPYSHHQDLFELLKFLEIEHAALVGCSQGGKIILDFTLEHPEMTDALVLVASALGGFEFEEEELRPRWEELEEAERAGDLSRVNEIELQIWVDGMGRSPEEVDPRVREAVREMNLIALQTPAGLGPEQPLEPPAAGRLDEISAPTLVIIGDLDTPKTQAAARVLAESIRGARRIVMPGTAHLPNMERPSEFNNHVLTFLQNHI